MALGSNNEKGIPLIKAIEPFIHTIERQSGS